MLQAPLQRGISRRTAIISLVGLVGLATIGGGFAVSSIIQGSQGTQGQTSPSFQDPHLLYTYRSHSDQVNAVAWSPDGKYIASGSWDKTVQVWKAP